MSELTTYRAARGLKMSILVCDVTFQPMYTKQHTHPILSGPKSLHEVPRFATIGRHRLENTASTDTSSFSIALTKQNGMIRILIGG